MFDIVTWPRNQWSVWDELDSLQNDMNRLFGGQTAGSAGNRRRWRRSPAFPPVNIWHSEDGIIVDAELPGVELKDIDISVVKDQLTISGKVGVDVCDDDKEYHRRERACGEFSRTLYLPYAADSAAVKANYRNGILRVTVPRAEETKPKKITIKAA
jgi:HSP20 family protein